VYPFQIDFAEVFEQRLGGKEPHSGRGSL
jgi:hypothetical protein